MLQQPRGMQELPRAGQFKQFGAGIRALQEGRFPLEQQLGQSRHSQAQRGGEAAGSH